MLNIISLDSVNSTNTYLKNLPLEENEDWTLVTASYQEAGRGAGDNHWESEAGKNLLFSLRIHPIFVEAHDVFVLSEALSLSVWRTLQSYIQGFTIKWPNDIYYGNCKVAGLLIENDLIGGKVQSSVMGVGLNVNQLRFFSDAPNPISLVQILGYKIPCQEILENFINQFRLYYNRICAHEYQVLYSEYMTNLYRRDSEHAFRDQDGIFIGRIFDVESTGHLVIIDTNGHRRRYAFKEVEYVL